MRVPDFLAGRKVRCPKCSGVSDVPSSGVAAASPTGQPQHQPVQGSGEAEVQVRARKPAPVPAPEVEDAEVEDAEVEDAEEIDEPPRPIRSKSREAISARPLRQTPPPEADDEDEEEEESAPRPRPRRFKRRRRRHKTSSSGNGRAWLWIRYVALAVIYIAVGGGFSIHMIATGHLGEWVVDVISWAIMMPISVILFFISMFIGSAIAGGIDFGDVRTAIPKAFFLLAPINAFYAMFQWYIGFFMAAPIWIFGLIFLFELDVWESWFMVVINWFLNVGANVLTVLIVVAMIHGAKMDKDKESIEKLDDDPINAAFEMQKAPPKENQRLRR